MHRVIWQPRPVQFYPNDALGLDAVTISQANSSLVACIVNASLGGQRLLFFADVQKYGLGDEVRIELSFKISTQFELQDVRCVCKEFCARITAGCLRLAAGDK